MSTANGGCHCGNISLSLELTGTLETYQPRACDCDFCRKHSAAYISDPKGSLTLWVKDDAQLSKYHQGDGIADLLICRNCGVLVGAVYQYDGRLYATVNVKALEEAQHFGPERTVSPKKLSEADKVNRWKDIWFGDVSLSSAAISDLQDAAVRQARG